MNTISGFTTKQDQNMLVSNTFPEYIDGIKNRITFYQNNNIRHYVSCSLVHGTNITKVTNSDDKKIFPDTDGLVTNNKNIFLCLTGGDCFPIYIIDEEHQAIGLAHSGWKSTVNNIASNLVDKMIAEFNTQPENIKAIIGPGIHSCHFEIKKDILPLFKQYETFILNKDAKILVDLNKIIISQLLSKNIPLNNISPSQECTYCLKDKYFSYRRDRPRIPEVMMAYIGITK